MRRICEWFTTQFAMMSLGRSEQEEQRRQARLAYENGLISKETYEQRIAYTQSEGDFADALHHRRSVLGGLADVMLSLAAEELRVNLNEFQFGGVELRGVDAPDLFFEQDFFAFEGSVTVKPPHRVRLSAGSLLFFEDFALLYATLAGEATPLRELQAFQEQVVEAFRRNRRVTSDLSSHEQRLRAMGFGAVATVPARYRRWSVSVHPTVGRVSLDLIRSLEAIVLGHELGHVVHRVSERVPHEPMALPAIVEAFLEEEHINIPAFADPVSWREELACDVFGLRLAQRALAETGLLMDGRGLYRDAGEHGHNPLSWTLCRGAAFYGLWELNLKPNPQGIRLDEHIAVMAAYRILFFGLVAVSGDVPSVTHPPPSLRNRLITWLWRAGTPEYVHGATNALDILNEALRIGQDHPHREHPLFTHARSRLPPR